jgi:branched-chain amino acid transport system substrate-binding protein
MLLALANIGTARSASKAVKIGVLDDMSSIYSDILGQSSVLAARMAIEDAGGTALGNPIELVTADHLNNPEVGARIAREWLGPNDVDMITGLGNASIALAVQGYASSIGKIVINGSSINSDITEKFCSPTSFHWIHDTYVVANSVTKSLVAAGGDSWFFLSVDYSTGKVIEHEARLAIEKAGGTVLGSVKVPQGTTDFSNFLLQAQASKAKVSFRHCWHGCRQRDETSPRILNRKRWPEKGGAHYLYHRY